MAQRPKINADSIRKTMVRDMNNTGRASRSLDRADAETGNIVFTTDQANMLISRPTSETAA
jgi:hypothetical protein